MKGKAMLHSLDMDGKHQSPLQDVEILQKVGDNDYIVRTPAGTLCHALFNIFTGYYFADDVYRIVEEKESSDANKPTSGNKPTNASKPTIKSKPTE